MVRLKPLEDFLDLLLWTGTLYQERPVSAILIAPPGSGKTRLLERIACDKAPLVSDLTSREVSNILKEHPKATHILLGDMLSMFGHKSSVVALTCRMVSSLTGETMVTDSFTGDKLKGRQIGLITAVPPDDFDRRAVKTQLLAGGFASRFIIIRYSYKPSTVEKIRDYIRRTEYRNDKPPEKRPFPEEKVPVRLPGKEGYRLQSLAQSSRPSHDPYGTRMQMHLQTLAMANAAKNGRNQVAKEDVDKISAFLDLFSTVGKEL